MIDLPDLDESGVYTFERIGQAPQSKGWTFEETSHEQISEDLPGRQQVLEYTVTSRELATGDNLDGRIARIAAEIEELKEQVGSAPLKGVEDKLQDLKQKRVVKLHQREEYEQKAAQNAKDLKGLAEAEERLTRLEHQVGPQRPPVSIVNTLKQLQQKLELLAMNPAQVEDAVTNLSQQQVPTDKVTALYQRFESLGPLLDNLPQIAQRLKSLEVLHADIAASQGFLKDANATFRQMQRDIEQWNSRLDKIETAL